KSRPSRRKATTSPASVSLLLQDWIRTWSPGQSAGSMLVPWTRIAADPKRASRSVTSSAPICWVEVIGSGILLVEFAGGLGSGQFSASQSHGFEDLLALEGRLDVGLFCLQLLFRLSRSLGVHSTYSLSRRLIRLGL